MYHEYSTRAGICGSSVRRAVNVNNASYFIHAWHRIIDKPLPESSASDYWSLPLNP
jgi:hypothetical protein